MLRPPSLSTLFPYTTLFRSRHPRCSATMETVRHCRRSREGLDRKSTRLNSSHQISSYAVFCLNKKKSEPTRVECSVFRLPYNRCLHTSLNSRCQVVRRTCEL